MRLTKWGYHADFFLYPAIVLAFSLHGLWREPAVLAGAWVLAAASGVVVWTLLEYLLHRVVLHQLVPFKRLHELHHSRPLDLIGTPIWISAVLFFVLWRALAQESPPVIADGVTTGLLLGYLGYVVVHCAVHNLRARHGTWLFDAKRRHALHHHARVPCNFGVSTGLWDSVFGSGATPFRDKPREPIRQ